MGKNELIRKITDQYRAFGINYQQGGKADITVDQEVLDAKFPAGKANIHYENSILISEEDQTVYFWEQTKEIKSGFSFGFSGESYSQTGATLSRKVKSVQLGPDGKVAFEVVFDFGQFSRIVKTNTAESGFKFKTVLNKKKAAF